MVGFVGCGALASEAATVAVRLSGLDQAPAGRKQKVGACHHSAEYGDWLLAARASVWWEHGKALIPLQHAGDTSSRLQQ